jgi:hypothetical protein
MSRRLRALAALLAAFAVAATLAACGEEETHEVVEGEPLEFGEVGYNVQITRFLNPADVEDSEYLVGQPPPEVGYDYLGVFLVITNDNEDEPLPSATEYVVTDTQHNAYEPLESESPYALEIGEEVPPDGQLPIPDSTAQTGPNQGSLLIFEVNEEVSENRPLKLEIGSEEGTGEVILDI